MSHPFLYPLLRTRLLPCFLLSTFVLANLFFWTYIPQVLFLMLFHRKAGAWINGTFLVLSEGAAIIAILFEAFLIDETQVDAFDAILVDKGLEDLVAETRPIDPELTDPLKRLGKPRKSAVYAPFSFRQLVEFVILLPLNFIPVAGVPIFLLLTGYRGGPFHHWRYFKLLDLTKKERNVYIKRRQWSYTWFGTIALLLQLIPVANMFFLFTTACGASLWAARLEEERRIREAQIVDDSEYRDDVP
ncbi:hypothetical protein M501DRAFT_1008719 [Patellaria atrata CBS 101060]|uniref:Uncharacterized protein n=1 Tax=Patellaria atrata CBS 101060 TaxID=1346257 RepID=A0A9P4VJE7_9PEZI|nr:hypothetical protein M501DRAFT_1008719 [Patellaria atrata CBS 101060]